MASVVVGAPPLAEEEQQEQWQRGGTTHTANLEPLSKLEDTADRKLSVMRLRGRFRRTRQRSRNRHWTCRRLPFATDIQGRFAHYFRRTVENSPLSTD